MDMIMLDNFENNKNINYLKTLNFRKEYCKKETCIAVRPSKVVYESMKKDDLSKGWHPIVSLINSEFYDSISSDRCINFIIDNNNEIKQQDLSLIDWENWENDIIFEFKYGNISYSSFVLMYKKMPIQMEVKNKYYNTYKITLLYITANDASQKSSKFIPIYNIMFIPELYPSLRADFVCQCDYPNTLKGNFIVEGAYNVDVSYCKISRKCIDTCLAYNSAINVDSAINLISYAIKMYNNRNNLRRKNSVLIKEYGSNPISSVITNENNDDIIVPIYDKSINEYILNHHAGSTHSHHASPKEHIRSSYWRRTKSGKMIKVKSTTVNKGNGKTIYELK